MQAVVKRISREVGAGRCKRTFPAVSALGKVFKCNNYCNDVKNKDDQSKQKTYFGFDIVTTDEKRKRVQSLFTQVAPKYDLMNDIMSIGTHRLMKKYLIHTLSPTPGTKLLDVASGTGDIAFHFLQATSNTGKEFNDLEIPNVFSQYKSNVDYMEQSKKSHVVLLDMNESMINVCKERAKAAALDKDIVCIQGTAEALPFPDNTFDVYTIAFGIRNVALIDQALSEAQRVLRKGGRFLCLEFSHVENALVSRLYDWYSEAIPCLGQLVAKNWKSYQYLIESIRKFPNQEDFQYKIEDAGFSLVTCKNICNGIAAIHSAYKL